VALDSALQDVRVLDFRPGSCATLATWEKTTLRLHASWLLNPPLAARLQIGVLDDIENN